MTLGADVSLQYLRECFAHAFPAYDRELSAAKSDAEIELLRQKFLTQIRQNLARDSVNCKNEKLANVFASLGDDTSTAACVIEADLYNDMVNAYGGQIETVLVTLFDGLERISDMGSKDAAVVTYAMTNAGLAALGFAAAEFCLQQVLAGMGIIDAAFLAVESLGVSVVIGVVSLIIVAVLIPIIYFIAKPAACIFTVINSLPQRLLIKDECIPHGKRLVKTDKIPASILGLRSGGLWSTSKRDGALIGTRYGVSLTVENAPDLEFDIGVECPLASGDNCCAVGINHSAEWVSDQVDNNGSQNPTASLNGYTINMKCSSPHGSLAYYIAEIKKD